jgi:hypothetical protein
MENFKMKKIVLVCFTLAASAAITAADFDALSASCVGFDEVDTKRCLDIIARHNYGPLPKMRPSTLAEKAAINAIVAADKQAVIVVLPDGSFVVGQQVADRVIGIPCESSPCPTH